MLLVNSFGNFSCTVVMFLIVRHILNNARQEEIGSCVSIKCDSISLGLILIYPDFIFIPCNFYCSRY